LTNINVSFLEVVKIENEFNMGKSSQRDGLLILDFDGVLNEGSPDLYYEGYYTAFSGVGCVLSVAEQRRRIDEKWGASHRVIIAYVLQETPELIEGAIEIFEYFMQSAYTERIRPVSGSAEMLGRLVSKYHLALNTAAPRRALIENIMPKLDIDPMVFEAGIITADQLNVSYSKPSPYIINILRAQSGYDESKTVMIGDSVADMESARRADVRSIAVIGTGNLNANTVKELRYVDLVVDQVTEVEEALPEVISAKKKLNKISFSGILVPHVNVKV
jgi:phosphoglycolate phosphatase-like HAD superfamily hydrolase